MRLSLGEDAVMRTCLRVKDVVAAWSVSDPGAVGRPASC